MSMAKMGKNMTIDIIMMEYCLQARMEFLMDFLIEDRYLYASATSSESSFFILMTLLLKTVELGPYSNYIVSTLWFIRRLFKELLNIILIIQILRSKGLLSNSLYSVSSTNTCFTTATKVQCTCFFILLSDVA